jgi:hypothetical protein
MGLYLWGESFVHPCAPPPPPLLKNRSGYGPVFVTHFSLHSTDIISRRLILATHHEECIECLVDNRIIAVHCQLPRHICCGREWESCCRGKSRGHACSLHVHVIASSSQELNVHSKSIQGFTESLQQIELVITFHIWKVVTIVLYYYRVLQSPLTASHCKDPVQTFLSPLHKNGGPFTAACLPLQCHLYRLCISA